MAKPSHKKTPRDETQGAGSHTPAEVDRRAAELAAVANRTEANDDDRARALAEFRERELPDAVNEDADTMQSMSRDPSDPMVIRGRRVPEHMTDPDEKTSVEKLALEGVEEAQDEQMLEARNLVDEPQRSRPKRPRE